ncbi:MAG: GNAT family N-acetyltransferase [Nocardioides sp.]
MSRSSVSLRAATLADVEFLTDLWSDALRRADRRDQAADVQLIVKAAMNSPEQRLVVAECEGSAAGAVLLRVTTVTGLNLDQSVQAVSPHVAPEFRRRGIGRTLMEAAVAFAEEVGATHVSTGVAPGTREANRFMARLGLGPHAMFRSAPTAIIRGRLEAQRPVPVASTTGSRHLTRVLAARRSMRRSESASST